MRRAVLVLLLLAAAPAARAGEGVYVTLDGGYATFGKDALRKNLPGQVGQQNTTLLLDSQMPDGFLFALHLGYNLGGHVAFEGSFALHPWSPLADTRGAIGITGLEARWFPLQGLVKPSRQFDVSLLAGVDYALLGGGGISGQSNSGRGFDGMAYEFGGTVELYPVKGVSIGLTPRLYQFHPLRFFTDFNNRDKGGQVPLTGNVGGSLFSLSASVTFHFEPLPD
jgi:hypothetical protein